MARNCIYCLVHFHLINSDCQHINGWRYTWIEKTVWWALADKTINSNVFGKSEFSFAKARDEDKSQQTFFVFQDFLKTLWRAIWKTSCKHVLKSSWKMEKCYSEDVFKLFLRHLQDMLERHLQQDVFKETYFKYDLEVKKCFLEDVFKTLNLSLSRKIFAGSKLDFWSLLRSSANTIMHIFNSRLLTNPRTRINVEIWFPIFLQKFLAASV